MYALFARVNDAWRFDGFTSTSDVLASGTSHAQQRDVFVNLVETENGPNSTYVIELPFELT
jgi:hypothetical protein